MNEIMTVAQCAEYTGFTVGALALKRHRSEGPPFVRLGRSIRYRRSDIDRWLTDHLENA